MAINFTKDSIFHTGMKEYNFDTSTHIGGWYIPENVCDDLINLYEEEKRNNNVRPGGFGIGGLDESHKKSTDMFIHPVDFRDKIPSYTPHLKKCLDAYKQKYVWCDEVAPYNIVENMKIQHYAPGEGFYGWHFENSGNLEFARRHLVFMTYLNTLDNAGTEFLYQNITTECHKGLTIIWPAVWTHTHRGVTNYESDKHIITGWFSFHE